jgi:hypothetical protein
MLPGFVPYDTFTQEFVSLFISQQLSANAHMIMFHFLSEHSGNPTKTQSLYVCVILTDIVRFQVLTAASVKFRVFWDVLSCSHVDVDRCFRGALVNIYLTTRQYIPENSTLHTVYKLNVIKLSNPMRRTFHPHQAQNDKSFLIPRSKALESF